MTYLVMFITLIRSIYLYHSLFFACHIYIYTYHCITSISTSSCKTVIYARHTQSHALFIQLTACLVLYFTLVNSAYL